MLVLNEGSGDATWCLLFHSHGRSKESLLEHMRRGPSCESMNGVKVLKKKTILFYLLKRSMSMTSQGWKIFHLNI